jgi:hypothetical protein
MVKRKKLPVAAARLVILSWAISVPGIGSVPWPKVPRRTVVRAAIRVWIRRRRIVTAVRVFVASTRGRVVARRGSVASAVVVIIRGRSAAGTSITVAIPVTIPAGAISTGWASAFVVVRRRGVGTPAGRARAGTLARRRFRLDLRTV